MYGSSGSHSARPPTAFRAQSPLTPQHCACLRSLPAGMASKIVALADKKDDEKDEKGVVDELAKSILLIA